MIGNMKTLVVDNNPVLLRAVEAILNQEGCIVRTAGTGLEALEILDDFSPDIVFTDLIMPMVSGEQLCRILRNLKKHENIFIVVLSAIVLEDRDRILREVECDLCIAKGNLQEIRQHVQEALHAYRETRSKVSSKTSKNARIPESLEPSRTTSELLSEKQHHAHILANLQEGILELNHQGKVVSVNPSALAILSCREENLIGHLLPDIVDWGIYQKAIADWTKQQLAASGMRQYDIYEDTPLALNDKIVTASFIPIAKADSTFGLCILRDISRQFKAEKYQKEVDNALRLVKKMDAMSCMAGGFSHDFNNLLTVICGNLDILSMYGESQNNIDRGKLLDQAKKAALVAVDLTRQISCFSNFGIVNREKVNIQQLVLETLEPFFNGNKNPHKVYLTSNTQNVYADPAELRQALNNVLQNAVEASARQLIEITVSDKDFSVPQLMSGQYVPAGKYVRVDVSDQGTGISSEQLFRIFDPYYSTKERGVSKGMGLGLTVVYAILRNHGGYVVVTSAPNDGTTVSLYLPALQKNDFDTSSENRVANTEDQSVLLIEPEKQMGEIAKIMLGYLGFSVKLAVDRAGAIAELKKMIGDPLTSRPLVILDLSDKNGESAVETCRLLHEIDPDTKVIAMSGTILDPIMTHYRDYGFVNTIPKPFSMDSLKHITNTALYT